MLDQSYTLSKEKTSNVVQLKCAFYYVIELRKCLKCILFPMWTYVLKHLTIPLIHQSQGCCCHVVSGDVDTIALLSWDIDQGGIQDWAEHSVWWHSVVTRPLVPAAGAAPATGLRIDWAGVTSPGAWSPQTNTTNTKPGAHYKEYGQMYKTRESMHLTMPTKPISTFQAD